MKSTERIAKIGLATIASFLIVMMLALGALAVTNGAAGSGFPVALTAAQTSAQTTTGSNAAGTSNVDAPASTTGITPQSVDAQQQTGVQDARAAVRLAGPAVVTVINTMQQQTTGRGRFGGGSIAPEASGSGVIIDNQGDIITNQHVVADQQSLQVIFADGTKATATLVGQDAYSDIAVIKVSAKVPAVAQFGNSDKLETGQPVIAIGTALGTYNNTVTEGIVSAMHRQLGDGGTSTQDLIQTDAAINHGNSGGPLLDLSGNVIGINTAVVRDSGSTGDAAEGLGFAIPSNTAMNVAQQLLKSGTISHPYLGITYEIITPDVATQNDLSVQQGVYVTDVASGSPAAKAGIVPNSIITKIEGVALNDNNPTLVDTLSKHKVGDSVMLTVVAPGTTTEKDITVVLGARPGGQ